MIKRILGCAAIVVAFAFNATAAPMPPGKWWRRPEFIELLALTDDQQQRLDLIFRTAAADLIDLRADAEKTSIAIRTELDQVQINRDNLRKLADHLSETQGHLFVRELMMLVDMRTVLNDTQWMKLRGELDRDHPRPQKR